MVNEARFPEMADMPASGTRIRRPNPPGRSPTRSHFSPSQPGSPRHLRPPGPTSTTSDGRREEDDMNGSANTMAGAEGFGFGARRGRTEEEEDFKNASFGVKSVGETEDYYAILNIPKDVGPSRNSQAFWGRASHSTDSNWSHRQPRIKSDLHTSDCRCTFIPTSNLRI